MSAVHYWFKIALLVSDDKVILFTCCLIPLNTDNADDVLLLLYQFKMSIHCQNRSWCSEMLINSAATGLSPDHLP